MCNQSQGYYGSNDTLSPAAQAVLTAVTQSQYCLDPSDIPNEAARMASIVAATLEAAADQVVPEEELIMNARGTRHWHRAIQRTETRAAFFAIAAELRGITIATWNHAQKN